MILRHQFLPLSPTYQYRLLSIMPSVALKESLLMLRSKALHRGEAHLLPTFIKGEKQEKRHSV